MLKHVVDFKDSKLFYFIKNARRFLIIQDIVDQSICSFIVPAGVKVDFVKQNTLQLSSCADSACASEMSKFLDELPCANKEVNPVLHKAKLLLKGVGYRANLSSSNKSLILKLGYSNSIVLDLNELNCQVKIQKNTLLFTSYDKIALGNIVAKLRRLRRADVYKGKGLWGRYDNILLKQVKKK